MKRLLATSTLVAIVASSGASIWPCQAKASDRTLAAELHQVALILGGAPTLASKYELATLRIRVLADRGSTSNGTRAKPLILQAISYTTGYITTRLRMLSLLGSGQSTAVLKLFPMERQQAMAASDAIKAAGCVLKGRQVTTRAGRIACGEHPSARNTVWRAYLTIGEEVAIYCPICAEQEVGNQPS